MFLSNKNQQILIEIAQQFQLKDNVPKLMKQYYLHANKSLSLLEMNKHFLLTLVEPDKPQPIEPQPIETKLDESDEPTKTEESPNTDLIFLEISLIKQELNEIKKMLVVVTQLFNNFSVAKNTDLG